MMHVFLVAPKEVQRSATYEQALRAVAGRHPGSEIVPGRTLFADTVDWRRRWKDVFDAADVLYVLPRPDMSVGLGVFKLLRRVAGVGKPCLLMDPARPGCLPPTEGVGLVRMGLRLEAGSEAGADGGRAVCRESVGRAGRPLNFRRFAVAVPPGANGGGS